MKRLVALAFACALPLSAPVLAQQPCAHSQPQALTLDTAGVSRILFDIGPHTLRLQGASGGDHRIEGRACASSQSDVERLSVAQERRGDVLHVTLAREDRRGISLGSRYAYLSLEGRVPDDLLIQLKVGSGDARLTGASAASIDVGSGDAELREVRGLVTAKVGSGDIKLHDIGALNLLSIGSGDVEASRIGGNVDVGSVGSGDLELSGAGGDVEIGSLGSGDIDLADIAGNVVVGSIGSGDLDVRDVRGDLTVRAKGSGDIDHRGIGGTIDLPRRR
ncbi:GIN domain-containing protein [Luteimonas abyssi]|uniref:GIN domain-containing protein n=1 Tax=Luteimonas abyssi TaxID=1247514 RepID=UPI000737CFFF|nr:DUF2807 domain-containing protein [Luteimonas abyssi]